jgi:DNA repair exonuclease SbcCD ATPase subunit
MLKIKQIQFRNFRSYGKSTTTVNFDNPGTTIIIGKNDDGGTTNGQGKTSILHCLTWLLYDNVIDSVNKDELINNVNKVDMWGEVRFSINADEIIVSRWRKSGKGNRENGVSFTINGEDKTPASIDSTNKMIVDLIGIEFDLFSRIVVYSASNKSFFDLPTTSHYDTNQTDMIERLFDLQILSQKAVALKAQIKQAESDLVIQQSLINQAVGVIDEHKKLIDKAKMRVQGWETATTARITEIEQDLEMINHIDFEAEKKHHSVITELTPLKRELTVESSNITDKVASTAKNIKRLEKEKKSLETSTCPYCNQHYADANEKLKHIAEEIAAHEKTQEDLSSKIEELNVELQIVSGLLSNAKKKTTVDDFDHLVELKSKHQDLIATINELKAQVNPHLESLEELIASKPKKPDFEVVNNLTTLTEHQSFLLKLLTKKDSFIRKALLHKNLPFLNERLAYYLDSLGLPHTVEFTPNLTASITQFGRELSFGSLSNGQRARVNFALSLAFGDVLQKHHQKINIQLFDEVLDIGLDTHGISAASRLLKRKARDEGLAMFIISHRDEVQNAFENVMIIKQVDGFSQVIQ